MSTSAIRLKVDCEAEFQRLRDRIDLEASDARAHFALLVGLRDARSEYLREMNVSNTFWHLTFSAHRKAVLSHLCLLYDQHSAALSLGRFLLTIKANRDLFSDAAFRERLRDNPRIDTLAQGRGLDDAELSQEIESVSGSDPLVSKLTVLRNETISHTAADRVRTDAPETWLQDEEVEILLDRASAITSKYSLLYHARQYGGFAGADDYKSTLRWVRKALFAHHAEIERQMAQAANVTG